MDGSSSHELKKRCKISSKDGACRFFECTLVHSSFIQDSTVVGRGTFRQSGTTLPSIEDDKRGVETYTSTCGLVAYPYPPAGVAVSALDLRALGRCSGPTPSAVSSSKAWKRVRRKPGTAPDRPGPAHNRELCPCPRRLKKLSKFEEECDCGRDDDGVAAACLL